MNLDYLDSIGTKESEAFTDGLTTLSQSLIDAIKKSLIGKDAWFESSQLAASIQALPIETTAEGWRIQIEMNDYFKWVDEGRKPGGSQGAIARNLLGANGWIAHRGIAPPMTIQIKRHTQKGIKTYTRKFKNINQANQSLAFAIGHKIKIKGYISKGYHFLQDVLTGEILDNINTKLSLALGEWVSVQFE